MVRSLIVAVLAIPGVATLCVSPVHAQCDSTGHGAPGKTNVAATSSSITVSWLLLCPSVPGRIELRQGGTSQKQWQDGALLGSVALAPLQRGGGVTGNNLSPATPYPHLRLCSVYPPPDIWCTSEFGAQTGPKQPGPPGVPGPPTNLAITFNSYDSATLTWREVNFVGTATLSSTPSATNPSKVNINTNVDGNYFVYFVHLHGSTLYEFSICNQGNTGQACAMVGGTTPAQPPAPPVPFVLNPKAVLAATKQVQISWTLVAHNPADWIEVQRQILLATPSGLKPGKFLAISGRLPASTTSYNDSNVVRGFINVYRVCGGKLNFLVCSDPSNSVVGN
jgi:hypothetical protein